VNAIKRALLTSRKISEVPGVPFMHNFSLMCWEYAEKSGKMAKNPKIKGVKSKSLN